MQSLLVLLAITADLVAGIAPVNDLALWGNFELRTKVPHGPSKLDAQSHQIQRRSGRVPSRAHSPARIPDPVQIPAAGAGVQAHGPAYMKMENPELPAAQMALISAPAQTQRTIRNKSVGQLLGAMLVRGRL